MTLWLHTVGPGLLNFPPASCLEDFQALNGREEDFRHSLLEFLDQPNFPAHPPVTLAGRASWTLSLTLCTVFPPVLVPFGSAGLSAGQEPACLPRSGSHPSQLSFLHRKGCLPPRRRCQNQMGLERSHCTAVSKLLWRNPSGNMLWGPGGWVGRPCSLEL